MPTSVDYLVVGAGLTGSTIARLLSDKSREVLILDRRDFPGGNVADFLHPSQIRVHKYGPHYFRCSSRRVWDFVNRFSKFYRYEPTVKIVVDGQYRDWPINRDLVREYPHWPRPRKAVKPRHFEEACLLKMPRAVYKAFVEGYTRKQWDMDPRSLDPSLADRIRINNAGESTLAPNSTFQGLPTDGYSELMKRMIEGIPCSLGVDFLRRRSEFRARKALVFTGAIDEFFGFERGRLGYRAHRRSHNYLRDCPQYQAWPQVNYADGEDLGLLRRVEWKHLLPPNARRQIRGTVITEDRAFTPCDPDEFEYPVPTWQNFRLCEHYRSRAATVPKLTICGRLGYYRYMDMDVAIEAGFGIAKRLLSEKSKAIRAGVTLAHNL